MSLPGCTKGSEEEKEELVACLPALFPVEPNGDAVV